MSRIDRIETYATDEFAIVRVYTDDGAVGTGQTGCRQARLTVEALHALVAPCFIGTDPWDVQASVTRCVTETYKYGGTFLHRALCGVDTAIYDLLGRVTGQSVHKLLGGSFRHELPVYGSSLRRDTTPEEEVAELAEAIDRYGFRCVKFKIGGRMGLDVDASPGRTEALVRLARETLGPDVDLSADANGGFSAKRAIAVGRLLEDLGYFHFEEPCPFGQLENTARVTAALDIPVAGGEQDYVLDQFARMVRTNAVDIVQPDIGFIGGITRARKVAEMAEAAGMPCTPHCGNHSMLHVFTLHLAAAMPAISQYQEYRITDDDIRTDTIFEPIPPPHDGRMTVPEGPGWGVTVREDLLRRTDRRVTEER